MNDIITLDDFIRRFNEIKNMGWIRTMRPGNTGIGYTLEELLGIPENNIQGPDFGQYELKSGRMDSNSMLTLITKSPEPPRVNQRLLDRFGYYSDDSVDKNKKVLHTTLRAGVDTEIYNTGNTLRPEFVECLETENGVFPALCLISNFNEVEAYWPIDTLTTVINRKLGHEFVYVKAQSRGRGASEEFKYEEAYLLGGISPDNIIDLIIRGIMYVDIRIGQNPDGSCHDHGTGFRIKEADQHYLYSIRERLA